jgi:hypothetical protein
VTGLNGAGNQGVAPTGYTLIRFATVGQLDFQNVSYLVVLNTSGNGQQPYAQGLNSDFKNWSVYFLVGGGANYANFPGLFQVYQDPASGTPKSTSYPFATGTVTFQNTLPSGNGFQIGFNRCIVDRPPPSTTPPPTPSPNLDCTTYQFIAPVWQISLFTLDRTQSPVDSLSLNGPNATDYKFPPNGLNTAQLVTTLNFSKPANSTVQNSSAQISGVEVFNTP